MKRQLPLAMVFIFGFAMIIQYFIPHQKSEWVNAFLMDWMMIIQGMPMGTAMCVEMKTQMEALAIVKRLTMRTTARFGLIFGRMMEMGTG